MKSRALRLALALTAVGAFAAGIAGAARLAGPPSPLLPANKASLPRGKSVTFRVRDTAGKPTYVWVYVSKSAKRGKDGTFPIKARVDFGNAKPVKRGSTIYQFKPKYYDFDWMNKPGRYYWQASRTDCGYKPKDFGDCENEGPIRTFTVKG